MFKIKDKIFSPDKTYIMGILNLTPDSFSDGGKYNKFDTALFQVEQMIKAGASIIDVGGESTRPGHIQISDSEEIDRVLPVLKQIKSNFDISISLDTYKSGVLEATVEYVDMANDIWGLKYDERMAEIIAKNNLSCCIMHNRKEAIYNDFFAEVIADLNESISIAKKYGISDDRIMLDGGVGFAKSYEQNLTIINRTDELVKLGYPVLIATSKKSVIGLSIDKPIDQRTIDTVATTVIGIMKGARFVRVHDITENMDAIKLVHSIIAEQKWG